jgi:transketolase
MGAIANGLARDGLFLPVVATFLQFSDYMHPAVRVAALSGLRVVFIFTHDSIFLGEDGPTHQPVEHLTALRAIPNLEVWRPADVTEAAVAWAAALDRRGPTALVLSRQNLNTLARDRPPEPEAILRGAYAIHAPPGATFTVVATGSEVPLAQTALAILSWKRKVGRLVSVACLERFLSQGQGWRDALVPPGQPVIVLEAARGLEWGCLAGRDGLVVGVDRFGESAPHQALAESFGLIPAKLANRIERWLDAQ